MKISYEPKVDVLRIIFSIAPVEESDEKKPDIILDFDKVGSLKADRKPEGSGICRGRLRCLFFKQQAVAIEPFGAGMLNIIDWRSENGNPPPR